MRYASSWNLSTLIWSMFFMRYIQSANIELRDTTRSVRTCAHTPREKHEMMMIRSSRAMRCEIYKCGTLARRLLSTFIF